MTTSRHDNGLWLKLIFRSWNIPCNLPSPFVSYFSFGKPVALIIIDVISLKHFSLVLLISFNNYNNNNNKNNKNIINENNNNDNNKIFNYS